MKVRRNGRRVRGLAKLLMRRVATFCLRFILVLPAFALGMMPWLVQSSRAAEIPIAIPDTSGIVVLRGHVFTHGCSPVTATLEGQAIRVDEQGNFAVKVRSPSKKLNATFEFSAPACDSSSRQVVIRPGVQRYSVSASLFPHFADRANTRWRSAQADTAATTLADSSFRRLPQQAQSVAELVERFAGDAGLDPALILAVVHTESNFDADAHSRANAVGLMQLVPHLGAQDAARFLQRNADDEHAPIEVTNVALRDPATNLKLGTAYLQMLMQNYYGDVSDSRARRQLALAAYNWGPGNLRAAIDKAGGMPQTTSEVAQLLHDYAPMETQRYVRSVTQRMVKYEQTF